MRIKSLGKKKSLYYLKNLEKYLKSRRKMTQKVNFFRISRMENLSCQHQLNCWKLYFPNSRSNNSTISWFQRKKSIFQSIDKETLGNFIQIC